MIKVKICGIQNLADAQVAAEAGADFVGVVFVPERHRRIEPSVGREISRGVRAATIAVKVVGLFADQPLDELNRLVETCELDVAQLCGAESVDYAAGVACPVIKVIHVSGTAAPGSDSNLGDRLQEFRDAGHLVTLDRLVDGIPGGTGQSFNWDVAAHLSRRGHSFILAGGLTPDTVAQAITDSQPWGVDVSSGVETGGVKDPEKIRAFVRNARHASGEE